MVAKLTGNGDNYENYYSLNGSNILNQIGLSSGMSYNNIAWFQQAINGGYNAFYGQNQAQQQNGYQTLANLILNVVCSISAGGVSNKAEKETSESNEVITENSNKVKATKEETDKQIQEILKEINTNVTSINEAIEQIKALGGNKEGLALIQEKLEAEKAEIQKAVDILNDPESKEEDKQAALDKLQICCDAIKDLLIQANELKKEIEALDIQIADKEKVIGEKVESANNIIEENLKNIEGIIIEDTGEGVKNVKYATTGAGEVAEGTEMQAVIAAEEIGSLGMASGMVAQQEKVAIDYIEGGNIHIYQSAKNLKTLGSALNKIGTEFKTVSDYANTVGSALSDATEVIGSYATASKDLITSVGSWITVVDEANKELQTKINEYNGVDKNCKQVEENKETFKDYIAADKFKTGVAVSDKVTTEQISMSNSEMASLIARNNGIDLNNDFAEDGENTGLKFLLNIMSKS